MAEEASTGWILHSKGRRFGPLTEDELRGYFRAGMVQSVDRLSAPGESELRGAGEVATMIGENPPPGPPPPPLEEPRPPVTPAAPGAAAGTSSDAEREARAARAMAAMNIDFAALAASSSPRRSERRPWVAPTIAVVMLVVLMLFGLNMMSKLKPTGASGPSQRELGDQPVLPPNMRDEAPGLPVAPGGPRLAQMPSSGSPPVPVSTAEAVFYERASKAEQLQAASDWSGLLAHAQAWSQEQPERVEPLHYLGVAFSRQGDYPDAVASFKKVLVRDPGNFVAKSNLGDVYTLQKNWPEALSLYQELVRAQPSNPKLWNNYGAALAEAGQPAQAIAALETAVKLDPKMKEAWTNLGNVYQRTGDTARASAAFATAR